MRFEDKLRRFLYGRNGMDNLGKLSMFIALILVIITMFCHNTYVYIAALIFLGYAYFRMMSKNVSKRYMENQKYLKLTAGIRPVINKAGYGMRNFFAKLKSRIMTLKTHHIYKCPSCGQKVRVPRGRGKIEITCPKCRNKFVKKS